MVAESKKSKNTKEKNWKNWGKRHPFLSTWILSIAIQFTPKLASSPAEDYLRENGYPESLSNSFNMEGKRIYGRYNPLSSLHRIGRPVANLGQIWSREDKKLIEKAEETILIPIQSFIFGLSAVLEYVPPYSEIDAFAITSLNKKECFIRPPAVDMSLNDYLYGLSSNVDKIDKPDKYNIASNQQELELALRTFVMAHEMRHCEQPKEFNDASIKESDADLFAVNILQNSGYSNAVVNEALKLTAAARIVASFSRSNRSHNTGLSWIYGDATPITSYLRDGARKSSRDLVINFADNLDFPEGMAEDEAKYHTARALLKSNVLAQNGALGVSSFIAEYVGAYEYLNGVSEGLLITMPEYSYEIDPETFIGSDRGYNSQIKSLSFKATP